MRYLEFKQHFKKFPVFTLADIRIIEPDFHLPRLSEWQKKGYIKKVIRGKYIFADQALNEEMMFLIANELLSPSYVSLESALSWHGLIPEGVWQVTSVTTIRTIDHDTSVGRFSYRTLKPCAYWGDQLVSTNISAKPYLIASPQKALLDFFYLRSDLDSPEAIDEIRLNPDIQSQVNIESLEKQAKYFENKEFEKRISLLVDHITHA